MNEKILILDDEVAVLHFFERALRTQDYAVSTFSTGTAAMDAIAEQEFDLALLDLRLKDMSGLDVLEHLRQQWPATPVILITAHASLETAIRALRQGAHDYLLKPCSVDELRQSVAAGLVKRRQELDRRVATRPIETADTNGQQQRFIQQRGLIIDAIRHTATFDDALLNLSPIEFSILAYLAGEAPRVISAEEIAREVQGYTTISMEARDTLRSHIYHIRTKLRAVTGRDIIRTVRGIGYSIEQ